MSATVWGKIVLIRHGLGEVFYPTSSTDRACDREGGSRGEVQMTAKIKQRI